MEYTVMEQYWIWLSAVEGIGPRRFYQLLSLFGDARDIWENIGDDRLKFLGPKILQSLRAARSERFFYELFARLQNADVRAVTRLSDAYPRRLTRITDPPPTLYMRGRADLNAPRTFAVVGSRRCTRDGERTAREFSEKLTREDVVVISGLAFGVDTAAHTGAVNANGPTIAVLGSGADVIYPQENERLAASILDNGGAIITEYLPGMPPLAANFPARNRIISGMSDGLLIVEGNKRSGAMITVNCALDEGKDVFAVPGSIYSPLSATPNQLIVDGAIPAISPWDILEHYGWAARPSEKKPSDRAPELTDDELKVVSPLREQSLTVSELASLTEFSSQKINSLLTMLELRGIIIRQPGGEYRAYK
jgi:DNA processing protein